ncbi:hypothetical protein ACNHKD_05905 [Methylocystis sp. JAN1]|uniref:hypothetical protein n=1 Tax=Methylocystis sp. JAN1 TaxID=3397211 RepID=UPI003FA2569B
MTVTFRASASLQGSTRGWDPEIRSQTAPASPLFYGGQRVELFGGDFVSGKFIVYDNWTLLAEAGLPVYQNLNGPPRGKRAARTAPLRLSAFLR